MKKGRQQIHYNMMCGGCQMSKARFRRFVVRLIEDLLIALAMVGGLVAICWIVGAVFAVLGVSG